MWCERCHNTGWVDCYCGGDLCICENNGEEPCPKCGGDFYCDEVQASDEQAAEIERLTAEVQSKNDQIGKLYTVCNEKHILQNANDRLRAALNEIKSSYL